MRIGTNVAGCGALVVCLIGSSVQAAPAGGDAEVVRWARATGLRPDMGAWQAAPVGSAPQVVSRVEAPVVPVVEGPRTVEVVVAVSPTAAARRGLTLTWTGATTMGKTAQAGRTGWQLTPGRWTLEAGAPRFAAERRVVTVDGPMQVAIALRRSREEKARLGLGAATGSVGAGLLVGGVVTALVGGKQYRGAAGRLGGEDREAALADALAGVRQTSTGTIVAGSGVGMGVAAASVAMDAGDKLLGVEVGVGAALIVSGLAWLIPVKRRYYADATAALEQDPTWSADRVFLDEHRRPELAAGMLLGIGAGLAAGAAVALVTRAGLRSGGKRRAARVAPLAAPRVVGLGVWAAF